MVKIDPKIQSQVWQRVQGEQQSPSEQRFCQQEAELAGQIQALLPYYPGKRQLLQQLLQQTKNHMTCLQGVEYLRRGRRSERTAVKPRVQDATAAVRRCYLSCLNLANAYEQGRSDPEYGVVYGEMAKEKRQHCRALLTLVGQ